MLGACTCEGLKSAPPGSKKKDEKEEEDEDDDEGGKKKKKPKQKRERPKVGFNEDEEDLSNKCERCLAELELRNPKQFEMELYCTILPFDSSKFELNERQ